MGVDFRKLLRTIFGETALGVPGRDVEKIIGSKAEREQVSRIGIVTSDLFKAINQMLLVGQDRRNLLTEIEKSLTHPLMSAACAIFADQSTTKSSTNNVSIWCVSDSRDYKYQADKFFEIINIEEVIYDWAWTMVTYGDVFIKLIAEPGVGIVSVYDEDHPLNISRLDYQGRLIGFMETPLGITADTHKLLPPWEYAHGKILGSKKRRSMYNDPTTIEFRTLTLLTPDQRRISSRYGTSVLSDALSTYKRLKLAEDSLLMSRISRGVIRYIYKFAVKEGASPDSVQSLLQEYILELKRARSLSTTGAGKFSDRTDFPAAIEDIILPVWGAADDLKIDKIGNDIDIKWIVDVEELRNQLATALRVPIALLSGYAKELPSSLGQSSIERYDIRFARQCYRVQRSMINLITRMFQVHLAFQKKNADLSLFEFQMPETSTAAEEELKDALDKGVDVASKLVDLVDRILGDTYNKTEFLNYINEKILKLNDLDFNKLIKAVEVSAGPLTAPEAKEDEDLGDKPEVPITPMKPPGEEVNPFRRALSSSIYDSDLRSFTPLNEQLWLEKYGKATVKVEENK